MVTKTVNIRRTFSKKFSDRNSLEITFPIEYVYAYNITPDCKVEWEAKGNDEYNLRVIRPEED